MSTAPYINPDPTGQHLRPDPTLMRSMLSALFEPGDVVEVRIPKPRRNGPARLWPRAVYSGFFDDPELVVAAVSGLTGADCPGVYVTLNPLEPDLLGRGHNKIGEVTKTATDADVVRLRHLLVDIDPVRKTDLNATDAEHQLAWTRMQEVEAALRDLYAWSDPVWQGSSGSGALLIYPLDLAPTAEHVNLIERVLSALAERFSDDRVKLDPGVANPSRLVRLAGTVNAKSLTPQPNRPWRLAVGRGQARTIPISTAMLEAVAGPAERQDTHREAAANAQRYDLQALLTAAEIGFREKAQPYGAVFKLDRCLTSNDHLDGAALIQFPSGAVAYRCLHDRCRGKGWADVRDQLGVTPGGGARLIFTTGGPADDRAVVAASAAQTHAGLDLATRPQLAPEALHGLAGEVVAAIDPTTEADPVAVLATFLTMFGCLVNRGPHVMIGDDRHGANLFVGLAGDTGSGRKGTSQSGPRRLVAAVDSVFVTERVQGGLSSGEGLVWAIRDPRSEPDKKTGEDRLVDPGITDKRLLCVEEEFSFVLKVAQRQGATVTEIIRRAWDSRDVLRIMTKHTAASATNPHVAMLAHITKAELTRQLTETDLANGLANRYLWLAVQRSKFLPEPQRLSDDEVQALAKQIDAAKRFALKAGELKRDEEARTMWAAV